MSAAGSISARPGPPLWLLAEVTYKCPLHCVYCSNPVDYTRYGNEISTLQPQNLLEAFADFQFVINDEDGTLSRH